MVPNSDFNRAKMDTHGKLHIGWTCNGNAIQNIQRTYFKLVTSYVTQNQKNVLTNILFLVVYIFRRFTYDKIPCD